MMQDSSSVETLSRPFEASLDAALVIPCCATRPGIPWVHIHPDRPHRHDVRPAVRAHRCQPVPTGWVHRAERGDRLEGLTRPSPGEYR